MAAQSLFALSAQGAATLTKDFDLPEGYTGGIFVLDVTVAGGTPTLDVKLQYLDSVSGKAVDIPGASFAQKSSTGTSQLSIYPGLTAAANVAVTQALTKNLRAVAVVAGTTPAITATLSVQPVR